MHGESRREGKRGGEGGDWGGLVERVQIHNTARRPRVKGKKKGERPLTSFWRSGAASLYLSFSLSLPLCLSFPLHLLKQYNNSFLSHPLSKSFYCDGPSGSSSTPNSLAAGQTIVNRRSRRLSSPRSPLRIESRIPKLSRFVFVDVFESRCFANILGRFLVMSEGNNLKERLHEFGIDFLVVKYCRGTF